MAIKKLSAPTDSIVDKETNLWHPVLSFDEADGTTAHIVVDNNRYVLMIPASDGEHFQAAQHWPNEVSDAVLELDPIPANEFEKQRGLKVEVAAGDPPPLTTMDNVLHLERSKPVEPNVAAEADPLEEIATHSDPVTTPENTPKLEGSNLTLDGTADPAEDLKAPIANSEDPNDA